jgi:ABC-type sulfate/molybdate transport systems ATPase subunit
MVTIFVTHDLAEASALCDCCAILDAGALLQEGPARELLEAPRTRRVVEIVGVENS